MSKENNNIRLNGGGKTRSSNFELLRIVCMLFIICGHIIMVHKYEYIYDSSWYINQIIRPFCAVAVNTFVLISGYFGIKLKFRKLLAINNMVTFYSVAFLVLSVYIGIHNISLSKDWMQFLPVLTKQYWFITVYFVLCLLSPFLNILVEHLEKNQYEKLLLICFGVFVALPTIGFITNFPSITSDSGYGIVSFVFLYLLGRYLRLYYRINVKRHWYLLGYILSMGVCSVFQILYSRVLGFSFDALTSYDTIFVFIGAICLFMYFSKLTFSSKLVNFLSVGCLAVYVIHLHPLFYEYLFSNVLCVKDFVGLRYLMLLIIAPCLIYLCSILIEQIRSHVFSIFE